jgi:hypothetical protein
MAKHKKTGDRFRGLMLEAACGIFIFRASKLIINGAPGRLRSWPRALLFMELFMSSLAAITGFPVWIWQPFVRRNSNSLRLGTSKKPGLAANTRVIAMSLTFALHALRMAIYVPGRTGMFGLKDWDRRIPTAQPIVYYEIVTPDGEI